MTDQELYDIYAAWTGQLHFYALRELGRHIDCEYFPDTHQFKVYSGWAEEYSTSSGIPGLGRPPGERSETISLYRPAHRPTQADLDGLFKKICLAAARVLEIEVGNKRLTR